MLSIAQALEAIRNYRRQESPPDKEEIRANSAAVAVDAPTQDELARDLVRQEANLTLQQDNLTTQQDTVVPDEVDLAPQESTFHWSQPTFDQVVSRWYRIFNPSWSFASTNDSSILAVDVSKALFSIQTLFDRVKRFRYWRGGVKIRLAVNSTPFHYGSLFCAVVPNYGVTEQVANPMPSLVWALSGQKACGWLSANTGKPLELTVPFQLPNEYANITQQTDLVPFWLMVNVMNPLRVSGSAANPVLNLTVFAQFTDFEVFAPSEITANSSSKKVVKADKEQNNATKQGTMSKVAGAVSDIAGKLTAVPVVGSIASVVAPIASTVGKVFDFFGWDKPTNMAAQCYTIERKGRGMQNSSGQDPAEPIGLKPNQKVSTETVHFGLDDEASRSLLKLIQTPMWIGSFTIPNNQVTDTVFKKLFIRPYAPDYTDNIGANLETQRHDYLSWYSHFFNSCRGGYRYFFHFDTSSYTTARLRITFEPSTNNVGSVTDGGDSFSRIIDINGAQSVVMEVPYCYPSARMPVVQSVTATGQANGQLLFSLVNPIQSNGASADVIYVNVFRCAADDFRYYQPHAMLPTKLYGLALAAKSSSAPNPYKILPNSLVEQLSSATVCTLGDGPKVLMDRTTEDEEVLSHNDFLHRYHVAGTFGAASHITALWPQAGDPYYWLSTFRAYRGSIRICPYDGSVTPCGLATTTTPSTTDFISQGSYYEPSTDSDVLTPIEVPYNNNTRFLPLQFSEVGYQDAYNRYVGSTANLASHTILWAAGDDFTVGLRRCPVQLAITIP